ncbi:MipA/OmpV family protein [Sphingomonas sp.]|uniref:MipA/OmpV family protein n=1 Tax=Sphingomonas sp. TaxID=28214 RepID=UPI003B3B1307
MHAFITRRRALLFALSLSATEADAQGPIPSDPDPARLANAPAGDRPKGDWQLRLGGGALYAPAFLGSSHYQLRAGPNIEIRYQDRYFVSLIDGVGADLIKSSHFRAGPILRYEQKRRESGKTVLLIAGGRTEALRGLGDVPGTAEAGGYAQYQSGRVSAKVEVRKGLGGHDGLIAQLGARYAAPISAIAVGGRPLIVSFGPRATFVDDRYNRSYFGVDARQSVQSGLPRYRATGGLLSYGTGGTILLPFAPSLSAALLAGYDRLSGDAGRSPLVRQRGSRNQGSLGLGLTYSFGG